MFKKYANDIHTTFKKKGDHQVRNMFAKSVPHLSNVKHVAEIAKGVVDTVNSLEK
jgi:hypothetical protein